MNKDVRPRASTASSASSSGILANKDEVAVEKKNAQPRPGCGCDCQDSLSEASTDDVFCVQCECTACGHGDGLGNRRCLVAVSPLAMFATALERGITEMTQEQPCYCGDCREYCVLQTRRRAVQRARMKRKHGDLSLIHI